MPLLFVWIVSTFRVDLVTRPRTCVTARMMGFGWPLTQMNIDWPVLLFSYEKCLVSRAMSTKFQISRLQVNQIQT